MYKVMYNKKPIPSIRRGLPLAYPGMTIGLFGGSFDPAHEGHAHAAETALKRLRLDRVWWLVTPQNPLKPRSSPLVDRMASARRVARGPQMVVTDIESRLDCRYTFQTLRILRRLYPGVRFAFITGADALHSFRSWRNWREIAETTPFAIISRPGIGFRARAAAPRSWRYLSAPLHRQSSTALRAAVAKPSQT